MERHDALMCFLLLMIANISSFWFVATVSVITPTVITFRIWLASHPLAINGHPPDEQDIDHCDKQPTTISMEEDDQPDKFDTNRTKIEHVTKAGLDLDIGDDYQKTSLNPRILAIQREAGVIFRRHPRSSSYYA